MVVIPMSLEEQNGLLAKQIETAIAEYKDRRLSKLECLRDLISDDCEIPVGVRLFLLAFVLYDSKRTLAFHLDDKNDSEQQKEQKRERSEEAVSYFQGIERNISFGSIKRFCDSVHFCASNIKDVVNKLSSSELKEFKLKDIDYTNNDDFVFDVENLHNELYGFKEEYEVENIPSLKGVKGVASTEYKNEETAFKYLYSVFVKHFRNTDLFRFLPIIIFQSVFNSDGNNAARLLEAVDHAFSFIQEKCKEEKSGNYIVDHIKKKSTRIYNSKDESVNHEKMGFRKASGIKLTDCFVSKNFDSIEKTPYELNSNGWYDWFIELCKLVRTHNLITDSDLLRNYIAFLCLSNILDLMLDTGDYAGGLLSDFNVPDLRCGDTDDGKSQKRRQVFGDLYTPKHPTFNWQYSFFNKENGEEETVSGPFFNIFNWNLSLYETETIANEVLNFKEIVIPKMDEQLKSFSREEMKRRESIIIGHIKKKKYTIQDGISFYDDKNKYIREIRTLIKDTISPISDFEIIQFFDSYFSELIKKKVFKFILKITGITEAREKLAKNKT
jgi:hypothetical protein